jgi:hypothetical protein
LYAKASVSKNAIVVLVETLVDIGVQVTRFVDASMTFVVPGVIPTAVK